MRLNPKIPVRAQLKLLVVIGERLASPRPLAPMCHRYTGEFDMVEAIGIDGLT